MPNFNKVILAGNLTRDPELRYTPKGTPVAKLGLAINRHFTTEEGKPNEEVTFVDLDAFGKTAENLCKYLKKGRPLLVEGRLRFQSWEDKGGQKRSKLGVIVETFQFLDYGEEKHAPAGKPAAGPPSSAAAPEPADDDDVPF